MTKKYGITQTALILFTITSLSFTNATKAAPSIPSGFAPASLLPSSTLPERAGSNFSTQPQGLTNAPRLQTPQAPKTESNALGAEAEKIQFKLVRIILKGNHVYSEAQLSTLYKDKVGKLITVAELQDFVQSITNYYRNNGYILSRAVLPPQHVNNGIVTIQIIEGYIDRVNVVGLPKGAKPLLQAYGQKITQARPLHIKIMEHYLLLANEIPGVQVKAVLEPSKTKTGASDLNLVAATKIFSGYISHDNYGTLYIGPNQVSVGGEADSIFRPGDSTQFSWVTATRPQELKFFQVTHSTPLGDDGARAIFSANQSLTRPGLILQHILKIDGISNTFNGTLQYPLIRSRIQNLTVDAAFNYIDSRVTTLQASFPLYNDHLRTVRMGGNYDRTDSWQGSTSIAMHVEKGMDWLGATPVSQSTSGQTSRYGASGHFAKIDMQLSRLQQFGTSRYSAFLVMNGQYALEPLLASEQFAFGGAAQALGRGYDPAEIIGDRGLAGSVELRMLTTPGKQFLQTAQLYAFYDAGVIWNAKQVVAQNKKDSATSAGFGSRFSFTRNLIGNLMVAQPLTRQVQALSVFGNGRKPRVFFSFTASA